MILLESILAILLFYTIFLWRRNPEKYPPGPFSWPILGNLYQIGQESYKTVMGMRKIYGNIIAIDLGTRRAVFINEHKLLKEAFSTPAFYGRCKMRHFLESGIPRGIIFTSGKIWTEQRKFTFSYIQSGFRNGVPMEDLVMNQISELIDNLMNVCDQPLDTKHVFNIPTINTLWSVVAGHEYSLDDPAFMKMIKHNTAILQSTLAQGFLLFYPRFSEMFPKLSGYQKLQDNLKPVHDFMNAIIDEHKKTYVEGAQRDFIDAYLHKIKTTTDPNSSFYGNTGEKNLQYVVHDLFMAGTESVSSTLSWLIFLVAFHPQIQQNLINTIKLQLQGKQPVLKDRPSLPYVEAVINEVLRFSAMVPLGVFHETLEDVDFRKFKLPKGTVIAANQYGILHDPEVWGDPQNFRPERFLSEDGTKLIRHAAFIPFSTGPRVCPGESFARDELFLFTITLFQHFKVEFDPSQPAPTLNYKPGHIIVPVDHLVIFRKLTAG